MIKHLVPERLSEVFRWDQYNHKGPSNRKWVRVREGNGSRVAQVRKQERWEHTTLLPLKMKEGAMSQGMQAAPRNWKKQGNGFPPRASRRNGGLLTF